MTSATTKTTRPTALATVPQNIPEELRALMQWLGWLLTRSLKPCNLRRQN